MLIAKSPAYVRQFGFQDQIFCFLKKSIRRLCRHSRFEKGLWEIRLFLRARSVHKHTGVGNKHAGVGNTHAGVGNKHVGVW